MLVTQTQFDFFSRPFKLALSDTFQQYSSFETTHDNANYSTRLKYANGLVAACKIVCEKKSKFEELLVRHFLLT